MGMRRMRQEITHLKRALEEANADNATLKREAASIRTHIWTLQMVTAAVIEKASSGTGAIVLSLEERKAALAGEWGITTQVLPDDAKPMIVRILRDGRKATEEESQL